MVSTSRVYNYLTTQLLARNVPLPSSALSPLQQCLFYRWSSGKAEGLTDAVAFHVKPGMSSSQALQGLEASCGLFVLEPLPVENEKALAPSSKPLLLGIYWPMLLRAATRLAEVDPSLAYFFLSFHDVIHAHSPFLADVLLRVYARDAGFLTEEGKTSCPIFPVEVKAAQRHFDYLADRDTEEANVYRDTLQEECSRRYLWRHRFSGIMSLGRYLGSSGLSDDVRTLLLKGGSTYVNLRHNFKGPNPEKPKLPFPFELESRTRCENCALRERQLEYFCCNGLRPPLEELWTAYGFASAIALIPDKARREAQHFKLAQHCGVFMHKDTISIRWPRWVEYRNNIHRAAPILRFIGEPEVVVGGFEGRQGKFIDITKLHKSVLASPHLTPGTFLPASTSVMDNIAALYQDKYPSLHCAAPQYPSVLGEEWSNPALDTYDPRYFLRQSVFSVPKLRSLCVRLQQKALTRMTVALEGPSQHKKERIRSLKPSTTLPLAPLKCHFDFGSHRIDVVRHPRQTLFVPSWDMTPALQAADLEHVPLLSATAQRRGVIPTCGFNAAKATRDLDPDAPLTFGYTYRFVVKYLHFPPGVDSSDASAIMRMVNNLSHAEFKKRYAPKKVSSPSTGYPGPWSFEEDTAIKTLYRPWMTKEDELKLWKVCKGRRKEALQDRVKKLRAQMIEAGVKDPKELPHGKRTPNILGEITRARRSKAQRRRRRKENF